MNRLQSVLSRGLLNPGTRLVLLGLLIPSLVLIACAPAAAPGPAPTQPAALAATPTVAAAAATTGTVQVVQKANFGRYLVDSAGKTLYTYVKDTPNTSNCDDQCATTWPPFYTTSAPTGGTGVDASLLSTTQRKDGKLQVTFNGSPLYYYSKDTQPGDVTGQGVGNAWYVLSPRGTKMLNGVGTAPVRPTPTLTPSS